MTTEAIAGYTVSLTGVPENEADYMQRCVSYALETLNPEMFDELAGEALKKALNKMIRRFEVDVDILDQANKAVSITFIRVGQHDLQGAESTELREHQGSGD